MKDGIIQGLADLFIIFFLFCLFVSIHDTCRWSLIKNNMQNKKGRIFIIVFTFPFFAYGSWLAANLLVGPKGDPEKIWEYLVVTLVYLEFAFLKGLFSQKYLLKDFGES
jgi:hypothetical protein